MNVYDGIKWKGLMKNIILLMTFLFCFILIKADIVPLVNGDFSSGTTGWSFWTNDTGQGMFIVENGQGKVTVTVPGPNTWSVGISNPGINIIKGRIYKVEFEAYANPPISIVSEIHYHQVPWTSYSGQKTFSLTGTMQKYSYTFTMEQETDPAAAFQMMFGGQTISTIYFDNIVITDMGIDETVPVFPDPLEDKKVNKDINDCTVFTFAQSSLKGYNLQIFKVAPDINVMNFTKWGILGIRSEDYDFSIFKKQHYYNILSMGGITFFIEKNEFGSEDEFLDMATRDANGELVSWQAFVGSDMYRGALANPNFRKYIIEICKIQIDGGADGIYFDEVNSGYSGGPARNWTNNEGFDDYSIADFNQYLMDKYPTYTETDWKTKFKMTDDNIIKRDMPANDLVNNFNYRKYLQTNNWAGSTWGVNTPFEPANPLAKEWGRQTTNRIFNVDNFTNVYIGKYLKEIFDAVRLYGMERYGKKIIITTTGIMPHVDFNTMGIYQPNPEGADFVPIINNKLNGSVSLMEVNKNIYKHNREIAGNVPLVFCLDAFNQETDGYFALPVEQKKDFWQIYAAEAYAAGCYYSFYISTSMPDKPTAKDCGVLDFFTEYAKYYRNNSTFYHNNEYSEKSVQISRENISYNFMEQKKYDRYVLHLINHNYNNGIIPQENFNVVVGMEKKPVKVYTISPDFEGIKDINYTYENNELRMNIESLKYYNVISIENSIPTPTPGINESENIEIKGRPLVYPNPRLDKRPVKIKFTISKDANVIRIKIYTAGARLIRQCNITDSDRHLKQGENIIEIPDSIFKSLAPGTYYYSISAQDMQGNWSDAKKDMIIIVK